MTVEPAGSGALKLGLIGDNIAASRSPLLHRLAGRQNGMDVSYNRLVPKDLGLGFEDVFALCQREHYRGTNITYPYKERVTAHVAIEDPLVLGMGAVNTVIFESSGPKGYNTDYSGFMAAYRRVRGDEAPGVVLMIGTGGVGRAVAFGLIGLGARELRLVDRDKGKAEAMADAILKAAPQTKVSLWDTAEEAAAGASGLINCTPVGMVGYEGTPLAASAMSGARWAFDAVYTPADTQFLQDAAAAGLSVISGWELFFYQGVHAWKLFAGKPLDEDHLRHELIHTGEAA